MQAGIAVVLEEVYLWMKVLQGTGVDGGTIGGFRDNAGRGDAQEAGLFRTSSHASGTSFVSSVSLGGSSLSE